MPESNTRRQKKVKNIYKTTQKKYQKLHSGKSRTIEKLKIKDYVNEEEKHKNYTAATQELKNEKRKNVHANRKKIQELHNSNTKTTKTRKTKKNPYMNVHKMHTN